MTTHNASTPQTRSITLPRGTLDLTYQINAVNNQSNAYSLDDLLDFAQRINPKRAFLFVSKVLGRHIPVAPAVMRRAFTDLAAQIADDLPEPILVIGMAETAVGLSAGVHQALQHRYPDALLLNSTRHAQNHAQLLTTFSEDHSHASRHLIYQSNDNATQKQLLASKTVLMVDDEASTGNTCLNVVSALRAAGLNQLKQVHLTTLVDWSLNQNDGQNERQNKDGMDKKIAETLPDITFHRHHLLSGSWQWSDAPNPEPMTMPKLDTTDAGSQPLGNTGNWGRLPTFDSTNGFDDYLAAFKMAFARFDNKDPFNTKNLPQKILVLGSNEFVWLPFLLAEWLEQNTDNANQVVKFSALTRSPIATGGAINTMMSFYDHYGLGMTNFVYNVAPNDWDLIVLCIETPADSVDEVWTDLDNVVVVSPL